MKEGTREDRIIARRHRRTLRGNTARLTRSIGRHRRGTGKRHEKTQEHMVTKDEDMGYKDTGRHQGRRRRTSGNA